MTFKTGTKFGTYEIVEALGAGGMGEVYRATDSRLKRDIAIKVLPDAFSLDAESIARFQREAEVLASLNHPHIAAIAIPVDLPSAPAHRPAQQLQPLPVPDVTHQHAPGTRAGGSG